MIEKPAFDPATFPSTPAALLADCEKQRERIRDAMRRNAPVMPYCRRDYATLLLGKRDDFLLPPLGRLFQAAAALGLGNPPDFLLDELKTDVDVVAALDALINWCREKQDPASANIAPVASKEDAALAAYLENRPDAMEDEAHIAINAALPSGARAWSLDKLRKNPTWRAHVERRIGDYMDARLDDTLEPIADALGYSKSTVWNSNAYQERRAARKARKAQKTAEKKAEKERKRKRNRQDALWRIARTRLMEYQLENDGSEPDTDTLRSYLLQCRSETEWVRAEWPAYVKSLAEPDYTRLLSRRPERRTLSPEEQDKLAKNLARSYQSRQDNTRG